MMAPLRAVAVVYWVYLYVLLNSQLGHDGTSPGSGWFVKQVSVDMPTKGKNFLFTCGQWLARDKSDGKTERTFSLDEGMSTITSYRPSECWGKKLYQQF
jgi:hypothetical protein